MTCSRVDRRIFVVGVPRSGTTLVQSLLAAHSQVTSFTESHFFSRHFRMLPLTSSAILVRDPTPRLRDFLRENGLDSSEMAIAMNERLGEAVTARLLLPLRTRLVARELLRVLDELALSRDTSTWVEKTPRHLRYAPFIERLAGTQESPCFVHVIREGLETVASLYTASQNWEPSYDLEACVKRWNSDVAFSLHRVSSPSDHLVFYEQLTARPEATLERLLTDLGLDWEPEILERYAENSSRLITPDETWKASVSDSLRRSATSERALTEEQRGRVLQSLRTNLYTKLLDHAS